VCKKLKIRSMRERLQTCANENFERCLQDL